VDDQSTDETLAIATTFQHHCADSRLKILAGQPRPVGETWVGKNWACAQAVEKATGDYLLFIDADVRLQPGAIAAALQAAQQEQIDLLTCGPAILCGCLAEWIVQPLMFTIILVGFNFDAVNDPKTDSAFAAGPFMFFRRSAYEQIGGHRAVAQEVVEDVELSRLIKFKGLKLRFVSGSDFVAVRMYQNWAALWEGWTKNLYLGSQRNFWGTINFIFLMVLLCTVPWMLLVLLTIQFFLTGLNLWQMGAIALSLLCIVLQYISRQIGSKESKIPPNYWWLTPIGGLVIGAIAIASIIKTETGWGWTWRGRSLKQIE
jgi:glycosyltransferase involved in cell wall biosynthesis